MVVWFGAGLCEREGELGGRHFAFHETVRSYIYTQATLVVNTCGPGITRSLGQMLPVCVRGACYNE